jgi:hypothetical protein
MRRCRLWAIALLLPLALLVPAASAAPLAADPPALRLVGRYGGSVSAVALRGDYAYVGVGNGLEVLDVSDPAAPRVVGATPLPRQLHELELAGDYAYALGLPTFPTLVNRPLMVIDIARPEAPRLVAMLELEAGADASLAVSGRYAYLGGGPSTRVFDLAEPTNPQQLATVGDLAGQALLDIAVAGRFLYGAAGAQGMRVFDVVDPREANELGVFAPTAPAEPIGAVEAAGRYVYTLGPLEVEGIPWDVLRVIDVSDPGAPALRGSLSRVGFGGTIAYGTAAGGSPRIYYTGGYPGSGILGPSFRVIDVSAPTAPRLRGLTDLLSGAAALTVAPGLAVVAGGPLDLVSLGEDDAPERVGLYNPPAAIYGLSLGGERLVLEMPGWRGYTDLLPLSVTEPASPRADGPQTWQAGGVGGALVGDVLYMPEQVDGLRIYTRSPSGEFVRTGRLETQSAVRALAARGSLVFMFEEGAGLVTVDASDPAAPVRLGAVALSDPLYTAVILAGERAYAVPSCSELQPDQAVAIIDISDPAAPALLGSVEMICSAQPSVAAQGDMLYFHEALCVTFSCVRSFRIVDVADPAAPRQRSAINVGFGFPSAIVAAPGHVLLGARITSRFILDYSGEVTLLDVADPAQPHVVEAFAFSSEITDLAVAGPLVYAASNDGGLSVLRAVPLFAPTERVHLPLARR